MDIVEIQDNTKIILQPFDDNRRLRIWLGKIDDGSNIHFELSRDTITQLAAVLHSKELERALVKFQKKATWRAAMIEANHNVPLAREIYKFKTNVIFYNKRNRWI